MTEAIRYFLLSLIEEETGHANWKINELKQNI